MRSDRHRLSLFLPLVTALAALSAPSLAAENTTQAKPEAAKVEAKPAPRPTLVFFMNPAGRPCQKQDEILQESRAKWEPLATLRYVRTDVSADREVFYQYGIRSLPNLLLVGPDGKEIHRYSPGIQPAETILSGISGKPGR
jgi:thioredoxin 1